MRRRVRSVKSIGTIYRSVALFAAILFAFDSLGCSAIKPKPADIAQMKVAKVDTDYVYESNVETYVSEFRASRRARISNFVGFSPDDILRAREDGIDSEVRDAVKRLPGVEISSSEVRSLADKKMESMAWTLYRKLTDEKADFGTIAREYSKGLSSRDGGKLTPFGKSDNPESYQARAFNMQPGDMSQPFSAWDGWRIIRLDDVKDDSVLGKQYYISMILLQPDLPAAEAEIIDNIAKNHTIEVIDPKYNSRRAIKAGNFEEALKDANEAVSRNGRDDLAHYLKARALWGLDRKDEALTELQVATDDSRVSEALAPYYQFYKGQYLQELSRTVDALAAYHQCFDIWRQDIYLAYDLLDKFNELTDTVYVAKVRDEIKVMEQQDTVVIAYGTNRAKSSDVIMTGEGQESGGSAIYKPGYAAKDKE